MAHAGFLGEKACRLIDELVVLFFGGLTRLRFIAYPLKSDHARLFANTTGSDNASCVITPLLITDWLLIN